MLIRTSIILKLAKVLMWTPLDFENEQEEMMRSIPPVDLTPDLWVSPYFHQTIDDRS